MSGTLNFSREAAALRVELAKLGSPEKAAAEQARLGTELRCLGCGDDAVAAAAAAFLQRWPQIGRAQLCAFVRALWQGDVHELRAFGLCLLEARVAILQPADLPQLEELLRKARLWPYVESLAGKVIGELAKSSAALKKELRRWGKDQEPWMRRSALLALMPALRAGGGDFALFEEVAVPLLGDPEPGLKKALAAFLRDLGKQRPDLARDFVERHKGTLPPAVVKAASKAT